MFSYEEVTRTAADQIRLYVQAAHRRRATPAEARDRKERAYGVYMGWRALVESHPDRHRFNSDDRLLESLLTSSHGEPCS